MQSSQVCDQYLRSDSFSGKAKDSLVAMGSAVFHGGFSTFLAFILLAGSKSHVFSTFFKVFFLVIVFGLFNGLLLLPVMLSLVGPASYNQQGKEEAKMEEKEAFVESTAFNPIIKNGVKEAEKEDRKEKKGLD